jgi:L-lactate dehydrogenase complex protein LldG
VVAEAAMSARDEILARVAAAGATPAGEVLRAYRRAGTLSPEERTQRFCERVDEYRATVVRVGDRIASAVELVCAEHEVATLVVPAGLPADWRPGNARLIEDAGLDPAALDRVDGALTGCTAAVAETGTIVLTAAPHEGRRAITLVPDLHICVVGEAQIHELLPEALAELSRTGVERRPITLVSGPSATSDIELDRVEGVHGPRRLVVLVAA